MTDEESALIELIRERVLAGQLPKEHCRMTWYGPGRGQSCAACGRVIPADDVEIECDLPDGLGTVIFHRRCYNLWAEIWPSCGG